MPDSTEGRIQDIADVLRERGDRLVVSGGGDSITDPITAWSRDPGQRNREMERLKQHLALQCRGGATNPYDSLSDDELMQRVREASGG